jgi:hypothetical protein
MRCFIVAGLLLALGAGFAAAAPMTRLERQRVVAHLEMTGGWMVDEVAGLSSAQLHFRPAPGAWNILEVLDHLVVCGPIYWQDLRKALDAPARAAKRSGTDDGVLWYGIDRTQRQTARPAEDPQGQVRDLAAGLDAFGKLHAKLIEYAKTTEDDLHGHVVDREQCDAYQWLVLISTHTQRHILQIREIKKDAKFPKRL